MQWLNLSYGAWFNRRWQRSGPLVQGRFKAILHEPENTALIINRYIHLNPVRVRALGGHESRSGAENNLNLAGLNQAANWSKRESRHSVASAGVRTRRTSAEFVTRDG